MSNLQCLYFLVILFQICFSFTFVVDNKEPNLKSWINVVELMTYDNNHTSNTQWILCLKPKLNHSLYVLCAPHKLFKYQKIDRQFFRLFRVVEMLWIFFMNSFASRCRFSSVWFYMVLSNSHQSHFSVFNFAFDKMKSK